MFDPAAGKVSEPTTVVVYGDEIVSIHSDAPGAGATVIDVGINRLPPAKLQLRSSKPATPRFARYGRF